MYFVNQEDKSISVTRGDTLLFSVSASGGEGVYTFKPGNVVRFKVFGKKSCDDVVLEKDFHVTEETESVDIYLTKEDTKLGEIISKPVDYWYEVELNPETEPQTIIGYDDDGPKIFKLFPEGGEI